MKNGSLHSLKLWGAMRLQPKELQVAPHVGLGDARLGGHRAYAPVGRAVGWLDVQRGLDQVRHALIVDRARRARANVFVQASDTPLDEARPPPAHRLRGRLQSRVDCVVGLAFGAGQHKACVVARRCRQ